MKYIFVTGGVVSSLGKGLTSAALGALLEPRGLKIQIQKFDPYLNVDPGTMSPFQHGEVYVLNDGAETDLDLGHYERFTSGNLTRLNNLTSGQVYETVIKNERKGVYLGKTVQVIPHVTNEIKNRLYQNSKDTDILITEIGGTIGDIEGLPFLEAMRQFTLEVGKENVLFMHVTLIPFLQAAGELKTKPSQQSVAKLREIGIQPDILICRTEKAINREIREKLSLFCNVPIHAVIEEQDVEHSIYELPLLLHGEDLDDIVVDMLGLKDDAPTVDLRDWKSVVRRLKYPTERIDIGVVGKYIELQDAYKSIYEALTHAGIANDCGINLQRLDSEEIEIHGAEKYLKNLDGVLVPGGFGDRGIEGKIETAKYARENNIPFFGICLGMQIAVIEFARNCAGLKDANSCEFNPKTSAAVIDLMEEQKALSQKGATMRLGAYECKIIPDTKSNSAYQKPSVRERHRHRYEFNNQYKEILESNGLKVAGINPKRDLVEIVEIPDHPWFVGVQYHPEFQSKPNKAHPLFTDFIAAGIEKRKG